MKNENTPIAFRLYVPEYCVAPGNSLNYVLVNHTHIAEMD